VDYVLIVFREISGGAIPKDGGLGGLNKNLAEFIHFTKKFFYKVSLKFCNYFQDTILACRIIGSLHQINTQ